MNIHIAVFFASIVLIFSIFRDLGQCPMIYFRSYHLKRTAWHVHQIDILHVTK